MTSEPIISSPSETDELQSRLNILSEKNLNSFQSNLWIFETKQNKEVSVDFNPVEEICRVNPSSSLGKKTFVINVAKHLFLVAAESCSANHYNAKLHGIFLFLVALARTNNQQLNKENSSEILTFLLTHYWYKTSPTRLKGIKGKANFSAQMPFHIWRKGLIELQLDWISKGVTDAYLIKKQKTLIPELTDEQLSYRDWFEGGNFNYLTLDHGRYYVEHCMDIFERHFALATALADTLRNTPKLAELTGFPEETINAIMPRILQGRTVKELDATLTYEWSTIGVVHDYTESHFKWAFQRARFATSLLNDTNIETMIEKLGLAKNQETLDRMKCIAWEFFQNDKQIEIKSLLENCRPSVNIERFEDVYRELEAKSFKAPCSLPTKADYMSIGLEERDTIYSNNTYPRQLIKLIERAGLTTFVALTGWRKSEYGFPCTRIKRLRNDDQLDQYAFPFRYQVDWYVYKTFGKIRQDREITFHTCQLANRLKMLADSDSTHPCLYRTTKYNNDIHDSAEIVKKAVVTPWKHFVKHFRDFKVLDKWESLLELKQIEENGELLTSEQMTKKLTLLEEEKTENWEYILSDAGLQDAWRRCRKESDRVIFFLESSARKKKNWLSKYLEGTLDAEWSNIIDSHLSEETALWLRSIPEDTLTSPTVAKTIMNEILADALYPTPHAFRHMWAEAVYRRFDGNAGWMIRSQFKHISKTMWLAYIRDKDNRRSNQKVKEQVISSLVHNHLKKKGKGYCGQINVWLRRLYRQTKVMTEQEQIRLADYLATFEIEDIKANPWGYCLLKRRTKQKAKCSEQGRPQRHNAAPELCLGCTHNLMQNENIEWVLFHIYKDVAALKNPLVPEVFKMTSFKVVKNASLHIRSLDPTHEALEELQEAINEYKRAA